MEEVVKEIVIVFTRLLFLEGAVKVIFALQVI